MRAKARKTNGFARFMWLYIMLFLAVTVIGLRYFWSYLGGYEQSTPERFIAAFEENLTDAEVASMCEGYLDTLDQKLLNRDAALALMTETIGGDLKCAWKSSTSDSELYTLVHDGKAVGTLRIARTGEVDSYGFRGWAVTEGEIRLPELLESSGLTVPANYTVRVNGNEIDASYITETGIPLDYLKDYYADFPELPTKVTYTFTNYIGPMSPVVYDPDGKEVTIDPAADDSCFMAKLSAEETAALDSFAGDFLNKYFLYTSGIGNLNTSYNALSKYLIEDSELVTRLKAAQDGLSWAHTTSINLDSYEIQTAVKADSNTMLLELMAVETVTRDAQEGSETYNIGMKLVLLGTPATGYKVATLQLY